MSDREKVSDLYVQCGKKVEKLKKKIEKAEQKRDREIKKIQDACDHVDNGTMFVFTCSKCGWSDSYSDLI